MDQIKINDEQSIGGERFWISSIYERIGGK